MENTLREQDMVPVTILRPCAVHGPYSKHAREWWFVKRLMDGRASIPLAYEGKSRFQTTSVDTIADATLLAANGKLPAITNVCDLDSPTVMEIGTTIMQILNTEAKLVGLHETEYPPVAGHSPWSIPRNMVFSSVAKSKLSYAETVQSTVKWLNRDVNDSNWENWRTVIAL